jgi:hypothetical protein
MMLTIQIRDDIWDALKNTLRILPEEHDSIMADKLHGANESARRILRARVYLQLSNLKEDSTFE